MVECARRYRQPPEACQPRDCESQFLLPITRARCAPCVGPSDLYRGATSMVGDLGLWWWCTKQQGLGPQNHFCGCSRCQNRNAWGIQPGAGVCTRSSRSPHAGHTRPDPMQDNELFNHLLHDFLCWIISFSLVRDMPIIVGFLFA